MYWNKVLENGWTFSETPAQVAQYYITESKGNTTNYLQNSRVHGK